MNRILEPLAALVGEWKTTGRHPLVPDKIFHGKTTYEWIEDGAFILMHSGFEEPEIPTGVAIFGGDDEGPELFMLYFDERGVSRRYDVRINGRVLEWSRTTPEFSQRMKCTIAEDRQTMSAQGEMSRDGGAWEGDLSVEYERMTGK